jgi:predicted transposase YbfD/YdcC
LVLSGVLCGANDWDEIALFGKEQESWLRKYGDFHHGIPSHDTINRVFSAISPDEFSACFSRWVSGIRQSQPKEVVAIDGKRIRNSHDKSIDQRALHMVSAFATQNGLCLAQRATDQKSNEITAIPELLSLLDIEGDIITMDAMGCQKKIASKIGDQKADYILAVKGNQLSLEREIEETLHLAQPVDEHTHTDCGHGRIENRRCRVYENLAYVENASEWKYLKSLVVIDSERMIKATGEVSKQTKFYISSLTASAKDFNRWIRRHWAIENNLHWTLDVTFREDYSRKRKGNAAHNFNIVLKSVLVLLVKDTSWKARRKKQRLKAAFSEDYRNKLFNF